MKNKKLIELGILSDDENSGVSAISLVENPAIEVDFLYFKSEKFVKPSGGESKDEFIGRCIPILRGEGKPEDQAIAICYSYWDNKMEMEITPNPCWRGYEPIGLKTKGGRKVPNCVKMESYVFEELDVFGYQTRFFFICPGAENTFLDLIELGNIAGDEVIGMTRSAAVVADRIFEIEKEVVDSGSATVEQMKEAIVLVDDFYDIIYEIDEELSEMAGAPVVHNVQYMDNHLETIASYLPEEMSIDTGGLPPYVDEIGKKKDLNFESYTDYPESAKSAAKRALEWRDSHPDQDCGTRVGWTRANQLAKGEPISEETIARMASFARHLQYKDVPYSEGCGGLMVDAWGGPAGIEWASNKLDKIRNEKMSKEEFEECPIATVDIAINLENRQKAIDVAHYGPLNPNLPNEAYWKAKARMFNDSVEDAKTARCGNCSFFITSQAIKDCIAQGIGTEGGDPFDVIDAGELGYCEAFDFKCAASRTCDAWVAMASDGKQEFAKTDVPKPEYTNEEFENIKKLAKELGIKDTFKITEKFAEPDDQIEIRYRYEGDAPQRQFCRTFMGQLYTRDEINQFSFQGVNKSFGHNKKNYSLFKYKGGPFCKHFWQKYEVNLTTNRRRRLDPVNEIEMTAATRPYDMNGNGRYPGTFTAFSALRFADEEQKIVVGPAMIPNMEIPRRDDDGDIYYVKFSEETIREIMMKFMKEDRNNATNQDHNEDLKAGAYVYESWLVEDPETDKANMKYGFNVPAGTWMVSMKIDDKATWKRVKEGELRGFSVEGLFSNLEEIQTVKQYIKIMKILKD